LGCGAIRGIEEDALRRRSFGKLKMTVVWAAAGRFTFAGMATQHDLKPNFK
jgi:hypothetical protein